MYNILICDDDRDIVAALKIYLSSEGYNLFTNFDAVERERTVQQTVLDIRQRYGKNAVLNGVNYMPEGTQRERNGFIGGHRAGYDDKSRTR